MKSTPPWQRCPPTLEQQVAAALADDNIAADKLEALIDQVESGIRCREADAARQREQAMDPSISPGFATPPVSARGNHLPSRSPQNLAPAPRTPPRRSA